MEGSKGGRGQVWGRPSGVRGAEGGRDGEGRSGRGGGKKVRHHITGYDLLDWISYEPQPYRGQHTCASAATPLL